MDFERLASRISQQWEAKSGKMDWLGMESILVDILESRDGNMTDSDRCSLLREAIDAWTRRGHFTGSY